MNLKTSLLLPVVILATTAFARANVIYNGDFSIPSPDGWTFSQPESATTGGAYQTSGGNPGAYITIGASADVSGFKFWGSDAFSVTSETSYNVSFDYQTSSTTTAANINWFDASNNQIGLDNFFSFIEFGQPTLNYPTTGWTSYANQVIAPVGAVTATFHFGSAFQYGDAALDNVVVEAVPEPATVALIGLALGGSLLMRRRMKARL